MPTGTCKICGCTDGHACEGGCSWFDPKHEFCSQCVGWVIIAEPNPYAGILADDLIPVRGLNKMPGGEPCASAWLIDERRLSEEELHRLAYVAASMNGWTVAEFLEAMENGSGGFFVPADRVVTAICAGSQARAGEIATEFRAGGVKSVKGAHGITIVVPAPYRRVAMEGRMPRG